jgi:uncharacterized SAM-binding protein YcdF (DUF218 family)
MPTSAEIDSLARIVWDYHLLSHELVASDCILVLGSNDSRVAEHGAQLWLDGWAPLLVFTGGEGALTRGLFGCSEAEHFAQIAIDMGVPADCILVEPRAANTGENITFTQALLAERGLDPRSFIVVQKPFMERRSYATFKKHWPDKDLVVTSPPIGYDDYATDGLSRDDFINVMLGDLQRIRAYPARGFQIPQEIPDDVWAAFEQLVAWGYDRHLIEQGDPA